MINLDEIKVGDILDCTNTKATVTFINGNTIHIIWSWGETDTLREEHFYAWEKTNKVNDKFIKMLESME